MTGRLDGRVALVTEALVTLVERGAVEAELRTHLTEPQVRQSQHVSINEILVRPIDQER